MSVQRGKIYPPVEYSYAKETYGLDDSEWERIVDRMGRNPNDVECAIFAMLWSESYCNKSSASLLDTIRSDDPRVIRIPGSRVGLIPLGDGEYLAIRAVANNNATYLGPEYGAQTSMDMALLELAVVGARPLGIMNLMRFGQSDQIANQQLLQRAVAGIAEYGNTYGVPVVGGDLYFHKQYNMGAMMNSCALGVLTTDHALTREKPPKGSPVIYIGAVTGRDGLPRQIKPGEELAAERRGSQKTLKVSDPLLSNRLISACAEAVEKKLLRDVVSAGVGGLGTACFDLAARISNPLRLDVDRIPLRVNDLNPKEILLSESSERLLAVATKGEHRALIDVFHKWDITSLVVGQVIDADGIEFYWNHYPAADIPFQFAIGGSIQKHFEVVKFPPMLRRSDNAEVADAIRQRKRKVDDGWGVVRESSETAAVYTGEISVAANLEDTWLDLLANPNICSRRPIYQQFDQVVGLNTTGGAGGDAAVLRLKEDGLRRTKDAQGNRPKRALALTVDSNSLYVGMEPYLGTVQTVAEGMRNLAAVGAAPIGIAHCLNFGDPNRYKEVCDLAEAIRGLGDAARIWNIPILSEFVSLFNGSDGNPTLPTPTVMMVGLLEDVTKSCVIPFRKRGDKILLLGTTLNEIGCSEYGHYCHQQTNRLVPDINFELEKRTCELVRALIEDGKLNSCHDVSSGGIAVTLAECCLGGERPIGASLHLEDTLLPQEYRADAMLFSESSGRFLISCTPEAEEEIRAKALEYKVPITASGEVGGKDITFSGAASVSLPLSTTFRIWQRRLNGLLGVSTPGKRLVD